MQKIVVNVLVLIIVLCVRIAIIFNKENVKIVENIVASVQMGKTALAVHQDSFLYRVFAYNVLLGANNVILQVFLFAQSVLMVIFCNKENVISAKIIV